MKTRREFLLMAGGAAVLAGWDGAKTGYALGAGAAGVPEMLDHILLGCGDLQQGIAFVEERTGVKAAFGGVHPGRGTQNALLSLGARQYLEIIAPSGEKEDSRAKRGSKLESLAAELRQLTEPRLVGWAEHPGSVAALGRKLVTAGIETGPLTAGSRRRPDGRELNWNTISLVDDQNALLPFFIEWGVDSLHPSVDAPKGCALKKFWMECPEPEKLAKKLALMGLDVEVKQGEIARLHARVRGMKGDTEL